MEDLHRPDMALPELLELDLQTSEGRKEAVEPNNTPEPKIAIDDFLAVVEDLCPGCCQRVKRALIQRLAMKATPPPIERSRIGKNLTELLEAIAEDHGLTADILRERGNQPNLMEARRDFARQAHERGHAFAAIGRALNRHHATIIHLLKGKGR